LEKCDDLSVGREELDMKEETQEEGWIRSIPLHITPPSLKDNTADVDRLAKAIKKALCIRDVAIDFSFAKKIPSLLREYKYRVQAVVYEGSVSWHLSGLFPLDGDHSVYGIAADLGTSTIALRLIDLTTGEVKDETTFLNPQIETGQDILTRIHFASQDGGLQRLQTLLIDRLNEEIGRVTKRHGMEPDSLVGFSAAGNTTMSHLFFGLDPYWICREPYIPSMNRFDVISAGRLGLSIHPYAPVLVIPNVGSYLGGDLIAGILASGMTRRPETSFLVDVGTNAEVVIGNRDWLVGCAGAAGPALEGGVTRMGMMASPGAISRVFLDPDSGRFHLETIGRKPPVGICGSGLIDLVAQLFLAGMIDFRGEYVESRCGSRLREIDGIKHLIVVPSQDSATGNELTLSQKEIDSVIRSKAAMYTILSTVTQMTNVSIKEISQFYIAGTFGSYIDARSAIDIGMIPDLSLDIYKPLGNSSLEGATKALLSRGAKEEIYNIRDQVTYVELNVNQEFMTLFSAAKCIPHTDRSLFPSVKEWNSG
jgi:uncharacterized 2Fe-2S/4Fe-4S cluster protein (DUF4445 family)